jgi:hypothetical protein
MVPVVSGEGFSPQTRRTPQPARESSTGERA